MDAPVVARASRRPRPPSSAAGWHRLTGPGARRAQRSPVAGGAPQSVPPAVRATRRWRRAGACARRSPQGRQARSTPPRHRGGGETAPPRHTPGVRAAGRWVSPRRARARWIFAWRPRPVWGYAYCTQRLRPSQASVARTGATGPPWGGPLSVGWRTCHAMEPAFSHCWSLALSMGTWVSSHAWLIRSKQAGIAPASIQAGAWGLCSMRSHCPMASAVDRPVRNPEECGAVVVSARGSRASR